MYERHYGALYNDQLSNKEIAAKIRTAIKSLVKNEVLPADWKYSVRYRSYAGGSSIDVKATAPRPVRLVNARTVYNPSQTNPLDIDLPTDYAQRDERGEFRPCRVAPGQRWEIREGLTIEARNVYLTLKQLHGVWNHDGSDIQVDHHDVKYYGQVNVESAAGWDADFKVAIPKEFCW